MPEIDYDALAQRHGGTARPAAGVDYDALAAQHGGAEATPNFRSSNEKDEQGNALVRGASNLWETLNTPLLPQIADAAHAIAKHIDAPALDRSETMAKVRGFLAGSTEGAGNVLAGFTSPIGIALSLAGIGEDSAIVKAVPALKSLVALPEVRTLQRAVQGTAGAAFAAHGTARAVTAPTIGEQLQGVGEAAAGLAGAATAVRPRGPVATPAPRLTPEELAANAFAEQHGVPLDAATVTGSRFVRGLQKGAGESLIGAPVAERAVTAQQQALQRVGGELAAQTTPQPVMPEQAGASVRQGIGDMAKAYNDQANAAYGRLRDIEAKPEHSTRVQTAPEGSRAEQALLEKLSKNDLGYAPTRAELVAMRQIEAELDMQPYTKRSWYWRQNEVGLEGNAAGGHADIIRGSANADVYHDLQSANPGLSDLTGKQMVAGIRKTLNEGEWTNAGRAAWEVAKERVRSGKEGPSLPEDTPLVGTLERVGLPVDLRQAKTTLKPLYDRLAREAQLVPLQGDKGRALVALDRLLHGPDIASASVVDGALGDLKSMARSDVPELRGAGQGIVGKAIAALEPAVQRAVAAAGDEAVGALQEGRSATVQKYRVGDVLERLRDEPVQVYRQVTAPKDSAIQLLRQVHETAPANVPDIARAYLEDALGQASERGRFDHADRLYANWQKLGPETKRILFGGELTGELNKFFLLAKRMGENPNPSGTAPTLLKTGEAVGLVTHPLATLPASLTMGGLAKLLYTPAGVRAVTKLLAARVPRPNAATLQSTAQRAALAEVAAAARSAGVPLDLPRAAQAGTEGDLRK